MIINFVNIFTFIICSTLEGTIKHWQAFVIFIHIFNFELSNGLGTGHQIKILVIWKYKTENI